MGFKRHTILLVPHDGTKFCKLHITSRQIALSAIAAIGLTGAAGLASLHYLSGKGTSVQLAELQERNDHLRASNQAFEENARALRRELTIYEDRTQRLAIIAGIEEAKAPLDDRGLAAEVGVGGSGDPKDFLPDLPSMAERAANLRSQLDRVEDQLQERNGRISARPAIMPVKGVFSSGYVYRDDPITGVQDFHRGIDLSAPAGNEIRATADGIVVRAGKVGGFGRAVFLAHGFGYSTRYGHLSQIDVQPGQEVERGDVLGRVGRSGRATGYHVHYEVHVDGRTKNPLEFILDASSR